MQPTTMTDLQPPTLPWATRVDVDSGSHIAPGIEAQAFYRRDIPFGTCSLSGEPLTVEISAIMDTADGRTWGATLNPEMARPTFCVNADDMTVEEARALIAALQEALRVVSVQS